jgi:CDP-6-deoxy-D-xylo-4-hexulose-3-dehydrase
MHYSLANSSWDDKEVNAAIDVIKSKNCTMGAKCKQYEEEFAKLFGSRYCVFSNSGSSANLLAITALMYRQNGPKLSPGDEVIVPAVSWSTTYYPIHQNGLVMKFVDINRRTLNIEITEIVKAITPKTKAIFAVNLLGNPCSFKSLEKIAKDYNLILLTDNCESMGAIYNGKEAGTFGLMGTYSSFYSHHISSIEGGCTLTNDEELYQIMISLRAHGWTRGLPEKNFVHDKDGVEFNDLFRFVLPGYNLRPNEVFAAIGLEQLKKLPSLIEQRIKNRATFISEYNKSGLNEDIMLQQLEYPDNLDTYISPSYFGHSMIFQGKLKGRRQEVADILKKANIDSRPIVAGDFTQNPVIKHMKHEIFGDLSVAKDIHVNGLFIGNSHIDLTEEIKYFFKVMKEIK